MGADLYIKGISNSLFDRYNPLFSAAAVLRDTRKDNPRRGNYGDEVVNNSIATLSSDISEDSEIYASFQSAIADGSNACDEAQNIVSYYYNKMYEDGYFRDSYNDTSLFWRLGLSWWGDVGPLIDAEKDDLEEGSEINLGPEGCSTLRKMVVNANVKPLTGEDFINGGYSIPEGSTLEQEIEAWQQHWEEKRKRFIEFMDRAIECGGIYAST